MLEDARQSQSGCAWLGYSVDSEPRAQILRVEGWAEQPHEGHLSFYAPDFARGSRSPWLLGQELSLADWSAFEGSRRDLLPRLEQVKSPSKKDFFDLHAELLSEIARGAFKKAVPVVLEERDYAAPLRLSMFNGILSHLGVSQFSYGFEYESQGLCGLTPEVLFRVHDQELHTMALAGTAECEGPSLLDDPKERLEHDLVIENLVSDLKVWGEVSVGRTSERIFGRLKHLHTPVAVQLSRSPVFAELVACLHPTAALGGWPRAAAYKWLERQSFHQTRGRFGAPFGFVRRGEMLCVVAIRGFEWRGSRAQIGTGCGVVSGSVAEREWQELNLKRAAVCQNLGLST